MSILVILYSHTIPLTIDPPILPSPVQTTLPTRCLQICRVVRLRTGRVVGRLYSEEVVAQLPPCRPLAPLRQMPLLRLPSEAHLHLLRHYRPRHSVEVHRLLHPLPLVEDRPLKRLDLPRQAATPSEAARLAHLDLVLQHPMRQRRRLRPLVRRQAMHRLLRLLSEEALREEDSGQELSPVLYLANINRPLALQRALLRAHSVRRQQPQGAEPSSSMGRPPAKCSRPFTSRKIHRS